MNIGVKTDFVTVPVGTETLLRIMVSLEAPKDAPRARSSKPLHLAMVLDRSGSMQGDKIRNVRHAARTIFSMMAPDDMFSLVGYDDTIDDVVPPVKVGAAKGVESQIDRLQPRGNTNLSGGYLRGCALAEQSGVGEYTSRVILLSDGLANRGETSPHGLGRMAARALETGITTTTIGVGQDYNEELMALMAEHGGGNAHFIERAEDAGSVFEEEFRALKSIAATRITVKFTPGQGVAGYEQLNSYKELEPGVFLLGDAYQGQRKCLVLEARIKAGAPGDLLLGTVTVEWLTPEAGATESAAPIPVLVQAVPADAYKPGSPDHDVTLEASFLAVARANREAIALADRREFEQAAQLLSRCAEALSLLGLDDPRLQDEIRDMRERASRMNSERDDYYDVMERKRMYHEYDKTSKGSYGSCVMMKSRRPQSGQASCPCFIVSGHPVIETRQGLVLLDTGASVSFGRTGHLSLFGERYRLAPDCLGQTINDIGALVGGNFFALAGADILSQFDWTIDLDRGRFVLGPPVRRINSGIPLEIIDRIMGVPVVGAPIEGQPVKMFLDTCAKVSYLTPAMINGRPVCGEQDDFFPGFGAFRTETVRMFITLENFPPLPIQFGKLPPILNMAMGVGGVSGILGAELLENFQLFHAAGRQEFRLFPFSGGY